MNHVTQRAQTMRKVLERWKVALHADDVQNRLTDALTDLQHYATRYGLDFDEAAMQARNHHCAEHASARVYPEREDLLKGMSRCVHTLAWADCEENTYDQSFSGCELTSIAPPTTDEAQEWAESLLTEIEDANEYGTFHDSIERADRVAETLGHYLAMEAMGHGVAWTDDHDAHGLTVPSHEQLLYYNRADYGQEDIDRED